MENVKWAKFDELESYSVDVFKACGLPEIDAKICADILISANKKGIESHGVNRLKPIYYDRIKAGIVNTVTEIEIVRESPTTAVIDGHNGMGQVIGYQAMQMAIEKAEKFGMGMTAVRNSNHYGIAGYFAEMASKNGMIGITGTNARPAIAPTFGVEGMMGTNPLTFAMPTDEDFPFFLDCATSIIQRGKIEVYARTGEPVAEGCVINNQGETITDSRQILSDLVNGNAALCPLGGIGEDTSGYKGYGYTTVVEILSSALQAGSYLKMLTGFENGKPAPLKVGHFFIAINVENFLGLDVFKKITGDILRQLRASRKMPNADRIYTAGEKEYNFWMEHKDKGIPLNDEVLSELKVMAKDLHISGYTFL